MKHAAGWKTSADVGRWRSQIVSEPLYTIPDALSYVVSHPLPIFMTSNSWFTNGRAIVRTPRPWDTVGYQGQENHSITMFLISLTQIGQCQIVFEFRRTHLGYYLPEVFLFWSRHFILSDFKALVSTCQCPIRRKLFRTLKNICHCQAIPVSVDKILEYDPRTRVPHEEDWVTEWLRLFRLLHRDLIQNESIRILWKRKIQFARE